MRGPAHKRSRAVVAAVQAEFDRIKRELEPRLLARPEPEFADPENRNIQVAQNVLRLCLEATIERLMPFSQHTPIELAIRLASYALSIAEMEDQDACMAGFMQSFLLSHEKRMHAGIRIATTWRGEDGGERPNFPEARHG